MKLLFYILLFLFTPILIHSQVLNLHKSDGSVHNFNLIEIDSITFTLGQEINCPSTINYDGKLYNTTLIGDQCWLKENLDVGTMVQGIQNQTNNGIIEKYCYDNNPTNCTTYGGLYQWNEAMQYLTNDGAQGICPQGWHIPKYSDFQALSISVSNNSNSLKAIGQGSGGGAGTNTSGFSALLAGYRQDNGNFIYLTSGGYFWSSTEDLNGVDANYLVLSSADNIVYFSLNTRVLGFNIRCLKD